jgi:predicted MPP superfamily phosphohydrolase
LTVILHFSDLHFGPHSRFAGHDPGAVAKRFSAEIARARAEAKLGEVELVLVTGDVTESARKDEFDSAAAFFEALVGELGLERRRFCFVPGNHDVSWAHCKRVRAEQEYEGFDDAEAARRIQIEKLAPWHEFVARFYAKAEDDKRRVLAPGLVIHDFSSSRISVAAIDTCERETEREHGGFVSGPLAETLMSEWSREDRRGFIKLIAVHHNPVADAEANLRSWVDWLAKQADEKALRSDHIRHFAADATGFDGKDRLHAIAEDTQAQLVLHGHVHAAGHVAWSWRRGVKGTTQVVGAGSWGLQENKLPSEQRVMFQLLDLDPIERELRIFRRIWEPRARATGNVDPGSFVADQASVGLVLDVGFPDEFVVARPRASSGPQPDRSFLHEYRTRLRGRHRTWELGAVHMGARRPATPALDDMYVPLRLGSQREREGSPPSGEVVTPYKVMQRHRNLLIRGAAGSGKTTWMRWTFRRLLEREDALPILIELRELARQWSLPGQSGKQRNFDWWLEQWVERFVGSGWASALQAALSSKSGPRPVLMVDGWDELGDLGREFREQFDGFLAAHPRVLTIATSRPYGEQVPEHDERFETLEVQPLSDREIGQLVRLFFSKVHEGSEAETAEEVERFTRALDAAEQAKSLGRTPLLLVMMLIIGRGRPLPDRRHKLYEFCIEQLLDAHPGKRAQDGVQTASWQWAPEGFEARLRAVARVALWMHENRRSRKLVIAKREDLVERLPAEWSLREREGFLAWLVASAGLMVDFSDEALAFAHLGFQEYLAAWQLEVDCEGPQARIELCVAHRDDLGWWETLRLWAALVEGRAVERLEPVLGTLIALGGDGFWLAGAMLADGLGDRMFDHWPDRISSSLEIGSLGPLVAGSAWRFSRQKERRESIALRLRSEVEAVTWRRWWAIDRWWRTVDLDGRLNWPSQDSAAGVVLRSAAKLHEGAREIAWARVWMGSSPLWCGANIILLALRLWPTRRIWAGFVGQVFALERLPVSPGAAVLQVVSSENTALFGNAVRNFIKSFATTSGAKPMQMIMFALEEGRLFAQLPKIDRPMGLSLNYPNTVFLVHRIADAHRSAEVLARDHANHLTQYPGNVVAYDALGISGVRAVFAQATDDDPLIRLLSKACQLSFRNAAPDPEFQDLLATFDGDPLWPALARHLTRASTPEDRRLLEDLAAHPEQRDGILGLGLRYWVRGDVMLEDGTTKTLEELGYELPLLDDVPPELDIDALLAELHDT